MMQCSARSVQAQAETRGIRPLPHSSTDGRQEQPRKRVSTLDTVQTSDLRESGSNHENRLKRTEKAKKASRKVAWSIGKYDEKRGIRMEKCSSRIVQYSCASCGDEKQTRAFRCGDRLCPVCARIRSSKLVSRWESILVRYEAGDLTGGSPRYPYLLTLTWKNGTTLPIRKGMQSQYKRFIRDAVWDLYGGIKGALCAVEVKRGKGNSRTFHPHMHVLIYLDRPLPSEMLRSGSGIKTNNSNGNHNVLSPIWREITGNSHIVDLVPYTGAPSEVLKYVCKPGEFESMSPAMLSHLMDWLRGMRAISTMGELYNMKTAKDDTDESPTDACSCGCSITKAVSMFWKGGVYRKSDEYYITSDGEVSESPPE